jgi:tetratricopeptide (TPR) repeat protein
MDDGASLGVPIVTELLDPTAQVGRNTVAEDYKQVIKDLTEAINSETLATERTPGYINLWAAKAILCRVYLYMGDNTDALATAEDIIANSPYKLWTNSEYVDAWKETNAAHENEIMFEFVINSTSDWVDMEGISYLMHEDGYADMVVTKKFLDLLNEDPKDVRHGILLPSTTKSDTSTYGTATVFINKLPAVSPGADYRMDDIPVLRLSEVYLNAAEAAAKLNQSDKAAKYLDAIVNRADPDMHVTTAEATLQRVLTERRKELVGEGFRFFDAMRNNQTIVRYTSSADMGWQMPLTKDAQSFDRTFYKVLLPIPADETNANPVIDKQQNPGY